MKRGLVILLYNFGKMFMGWTLHMIMCALLCYPVFICMSQLQSTGRPISSLCMQCQYYGIETICTEIPKQNITTTCKTVPIPGLRVLVHPKQHGPLLSTT